MHEILLINTRGSPSDSGVGGGDKRAVVVAKLVIRYSGSSFLYVKIFPSLL